jgi:hypothetical protein
MPSINSIDPYLSYVQQGYAIANAPYPTSYPSTSGTSSTSSTTSPTTTATSTNMATLLENYQTLFDGSMPIADVGLDAQA